jgi:hypothetical protein
MITRLEGRRVTLSSSYTDSENYFHDCVMKQQATGKV